MRDNGVIIMYGAMNGIDLKWNVLEPLFRGVSMKVCVCGRAAV